uniref:Uncharacterized protein n=1 Tax=Grammatophora oceanica TaxID=210454 RepID=A0A7S1VIC7_9STRA
MFLRCVYHLSSVMNVLRIDLNLSLLSHLLSQVLVVSMESASQSSSLVCEPCCALYKDKEWHEDGNQKVWGVKLRHRLDLCSLGSSRDFFTFRLAATYEC